MFYIDVKLFLLTESIKSYEDETTVKSSKRFPTDVLYAQSEIIYYKREQDMLNKKMSYRQ